MFAAVSIQNEFSRQTSILQDVCLFIVTVYVKPWLEWSLAVKAPYQDLCFLKTLKDYEKVDKIVSQAPLSKFCQHLWYLSEEIAILSLFDKLVDGKTKMKMVVHLERENVSNFGKKYVPTKEEISSSLYGM